MSDQQASNAEIAEAWIACTERCRPLDGQSRVRDDDPAWWAIDTVMELEFRDPVRALEVAFVIARQSSDGWVLENLGAGPLETLLSRDPTFLDAITIETASNPNLLEALCSVWKNEMPDETWSVIRNLTGR